MHCWKTATVATHCQRRSLPAVRAARPRWRRQLRRLAGAQRSLRRALRVLRQLELPARTTLVAATAWSWARRTRRPRAAARGGLGSVLGRLASTPRSELLRARLCWRVRALADPLGALRSDGPFAFASSEEEAETAPAPPPPQQQCPPPRQPQHRPPPPQQQQHQQQQASLSAAARSAVGATLQFVASAARGAAAPSAPAAASGSGTATATARQQPTPSASTQPVAQAQAPQQAPVKGLAKGFLGRGGSGGSGKPPAQTAAAAPTAQANLRPQTASGSAGLAKGFLGCGGSGGSGKPPAQTAAAAPAVQAPPQTASGGTGLIKGFFDSNAKGGKAQRVARYIETLDGALSADDKDGAEVRVGLMGAASCSATQLAALEPHLGHKALIEVHPRDRPLWTAWSRRLSS
jgi:hypothetical protein